MRTSHSPAMAFAAAQLPAGEREPGGWRIVACEGTYLLSYEDAQGVPSMRCLEARELRIGPGRLLLGGIDHDSQAYRGFRADRIRSLYHVETGEWVERNVVDWLMKLAKSSARPRRG